MRARHALNTATQALRSVRVLRLRRIVPVPPPDRARRTAQPTCRHAVHARVAEARCGYRRGETCCEGRCSRGDVYDDRRASDARVRAYPVSRPAAPRWVIPLVILALLLALAGLGVDAYALHTQPAKVSGPTGAQGVQGRKGSKGSRDRRARSRRRASCEGPRRSLRRTPPRAPCSTPRPRARPARSW